MTMKMEADVALRSLQRPFRKLQIVEDWKQQYRVHSGRYKFLVLTGPSCMGKTQFALSLSPIGASLHLNMAVAPEPDLREFKYLHHDLILFDEAGPEQVVRQRLVFQAGNSWVQLGCSPTNQASYKVWMYRKKLVVSGNDWWGRLQSLHDSDQSWLQANSVVVDVDSPLFE